MNARANTLEVYLKKCLNYQILICSHMALHGGNDNDDDDDGIIASRAKEKGEEGKKGDRHSPTNYQS